jgi:hypothetical protein
MQQWPRGARSYFLQNFEISFYTNKFLVFSRL